MDMSSLSTQVGMEAKFIPGKKVGVSYLVNEDNHLYSRVYNKKEDGKTRTLWKCIVNNIPKCPATATTKKERDVDKEILSSLGKNEHNHVADLSKLLKLQQVAKAKSDAVEQTALSPRTVFGNLANNIEAKGEVVPIKYSTMARAMSRVRSKLDARPKAPTCYKDAIDNLPEELKILMDGSQFLLYAGEVSEENNDDTAPDDPTMMIFLTFHGAERLRVSKTWLCDGTFKSAPAPFMQVYIIFAQMESGKVLPACFCLLPNKDKPTYTMMWTKIHQAVESYSPSTLVLDMEPASADTFLNIFGQVKIIYCYFHWRKALRDQLGRKHCLTDVQQDPVFNNIYRLTTALAFVPPEKITEVFIGVLEPMVEENEENLSEEALDWFEYFTKTYIGAINSRTGVRRAAKIKPERWSQYYTLIQDKPYTTNSVEGFNNAWNGSSALNSTVWVTVDHFKKEETLAMSRWREEATTVQPRLAEADDSGSCRNIKQREKVAKLKNLCSQVDTFSGALMKDFLKLVSAAIED